MFTFEQKTGRVTHDGKYVGTGYSGRGEGKNNPEWVTVRSFGPIPCGTYDICPPHDDPKLGPYVMALKPHPENDMYNRSGFYLHGDNIQHNASEGCIILSRYLRELIGTSGDKVLEVLDGVD